MKRRAVKRQSVNIVEIAFDDEDEHQDDDDKII